MIARKKKSFLITILAVAMAGCGGGGGGGQSGGGLLSDEARSAEQGTGQPFKLPIAYTSSIYDSHSTYRHSIQPLAADDIGFFKGKLPAPPAGSDTPFAPDIISVDLFGSSLKGGLEETIYDLVAGETINLISPLAVASQNALVAVAAPNSPETIVTLRLLKTENQEVICEATGQAEEVLCYAQISQSSATPPIGVYATVTPSNSIDEMEVKLEVDVSDGIRTYFDTGRFFVAPDQLYDSKSLVDMSVFPSSALSRASGYTVFLYFPDHDITAFFPSTSIMFSDTRRSFKLALGGINFYEATRLAQGFQSVDARIFYQDLSIDTVLSGEWPGKSLANKWSHTKTIEIVPRPVTSPSSGEDISSSDGTDGLGGARSSYTFTCPTPGSSPVTVQVTSGTCRNAQEAYSKTYACNEIANFGSTCRDLYQCAVNNSTGIYVEYYQRFLTGCY